MAAKTTQTPENLTGAQYRALRKAKLDADWHAKWPEGAYYLIVLDTGAIFGHLTRRPTSVIQRVREHGSTAPGWSGWYVGRDFVRHKGLRHHKLYPTRDAWLAARAKYGAPLQQENDDDR